MFMVCGLSASAQRDSVIVNDGWRKDTIRARGQVSDTISKETEMIIWDNTVRESSEKKGLTIRSNLLVLGCQGIILKAWPSGTNFEDTGTGSILGL